MQVVVRVHRRRRRLRLQARRCGCSGRRRGERREVLLQLRRKDPAPPHRRRAALCRRRQPSPLRRPSRPVSRATTEAAGAMRVGGVPAVPAADGGPGRARLRHERRRPRQPAERVRRGQQGPSPAAQDPGVPVPAEAAAGGGVPASVLQHAVHTGVRVRQAIGIESSSSPHAEHLPVPSPRAFAGVVRAAVVGAAAGLPAPGARAPSAVLRPARPRRGAAPLVPRPQWQPLAMMGQEPRALGSLPWDRKNGVHEGPPRYACVHVRNV